MPGELHEKLMLQKVLLDVRGKLMLEKVPGGSAWKTNFGKSVLGKCAENLCWKKCLVNCMRNLMLGKVPGKLHEKLTLEKVL